MKIADVRDSKSTSGGLPCVFGSRTFVPSSWMSSAESEIISLDAGLRMDGLPDLQIWDVCLGSIIQ